MIQKNLPLGRWGARGRNGNMHCYEEMDYEVDSAPKEKSKTFEITQILQ